MTPETWFTRSDPKDDIDAPIQSEYHTNEDPPCDPCALCGKDFCFSSDLDFFPEFFPRIFRVQLSQFAKQFFSPLVARHRDGYRDLDDLVAAFAVFCG